MVYCNSKIVIIDFNVREPKMYPLFLDDELLEIKIDYRDEKFWYTLDINKEADTPRNRERQKQDRKHWRQTLLFFGGLILAVLLFLSVMRHLHPEEESINVPALLAAEGVTTTAKITKIEAKNEGSLISLTFLADGQVEKHQFTYHQAPPIRLDYGLELAVDDEFAISYAKSQPSAFKLQLNHPTEAQTERYFDLTLQKHLQLNPTQSSAFAKCQLDIAFELKGLEGLADFYFQNSTSSDNPFHNEYSYKRLTRGVPFLERLKARCQ